MGLKSFSGNFPVLKDISIAKNYLNDEELKILNNIVSGYFDFAEIQAMRHNPMYLSLIHIYERVLEGAEQIMVTFANDTQVEATVKKIDHNTEIAILSVRMDTLEEDTRNAVEVAVLGNSFQVRKGTPVIAIGSPLGLSLIHISGHYRRICGSKPPSEKDGL